MLSPHQEPDPMTLSHDEIYDLLTQFAYAPPWGPDRAAAHLEELLAVPAIPDSSESAAVAMLRPKTAALVYDRVWGLAGEVPDPIRFGALSTTEVLLAVNRVIHWRANGRPPDIPSAARGFYEALDRYFSIAEFGGHPYLH
jgi:hypothetical protein